ncbi:HEAT repeat domain-containing protein [Actinomycetes bacterium KLBMP 9797]
MRYGDLLAQTDWSVVEHAYAGMPVVPQTPQILAALLSDDPACQSRALGDLYGVVHHQDTIYSATAPAVNFVVAVLGDPRMLTPVPVGSGSHVTHVALRAALLDWLTSVMEAAAGADERTPGQHADIAACRAARPNVYRAAYAMRADPDPAVVSAALGTLACLLDAQELAHHRPEVATWLHDHALASTDRRTRVLAVMILESWAYDTTPLLEKDPDPVVRATAALSPAHAAKPEATTALLDVLSSPAAAAWCQQVFPHFGRIFPFKLLATAIDRATLDELIAVLAVLLADAPPGTYAGDWGARLRAKAFPDGFPPSAPLNPAQQAFLDLVAERCFGPTAPPVWFGTDPRLALSDLVPQGATFVRGPTS